MIPSVSLLAAPVSAPTSVAHLQDTTVYNEFRAPVVSDFVMFTDGSTDYFNWLVSGSPSDFQVMFSPSSGSASGLGYAPANTWLDFSVNRKWGVKINSGTGTVTCIGTLQLRYAATGDLAATCQLTLSVKATSGAGA